LSGGTGPRFSLSGRTNWSATPCAQRAYAIGLAHFFSWLRASGGDPDQTVKSFEVSPYASAHVMPRKS
jgi:hypothetical protein